METIACRECDLLQELPPLRIGGRACCARCGATLAHRRADPIERPLALTSAALLIFVVANVTPLMSLSAAGRHASTTILGGAVDTWQQGSQLTAAVVAFCAVIAPAAYLLFLLVILLAASRPPAPRWVGEMLHLAQLMKVWSMTEVMMLGIMVALVKIAQVATVIPGIGMIAQGAFIGLIAGVVVSFDPREIWSTVRWADGTHGPASEGAPE